MFQFAAISRRQAARRDAGPWSPATFPYTKATENKSEVSSAGAVLRADDADAEQLQHTTSMAMAATVPSVMESFEFVIDGA